MTLTPQQALLRCIEHREIFHDEMLALFRQIMDGEMSPVMIAALTMGLVGKVVAHDELDAGAGKQAPFALQAGDRENGHMPKATRRSLARRRLR